jgi:hypothetical protein
MDTNYLDTTVGPALVEALARIIELNPADPIEYLGQYLIRHGGSEPAQSPTPTPSNPMKQS